MLRQITKIPLFVGTLLVAGIFTRGSAQSAAEQVRVDKIELLEIQADRIGFAVTPSILPANRVRVRMITFYGMRINKIPIFIPPISEEIQLVPGVRATPRKPLQVTVYFRDLNTFQPIIELIRGSRLKIEGNALIEARLDLLPSLLLLRKTAHAPIRVDADLPLEVPGGQVARDQALKALSLAEAGRGFVQKSLLALLGTDEVQKRLQARFGRSLMLALARYEMTDSNHNRYPVERMGVAFRSGEKQFVTVREMTEPWKFDSAIVLKLKNKELTMVKDSYDLLLWPAGSTYAQLTGAPIERNAVSMKRRDFRVVQSTDNESERMVATRTGTRATLVSTMPRASGSNLAVLEFDTPPKTGPAVTSIDHTNNTGFSVLVAFRFPAGPYTQVVEPEMVRLSGRIVNGRLVLDDPIDSSALGSPVFSDDGLIGILQDETSAILYSQAATKLKLNADPK